MIYLLVFLFLFVLMVIAWYLTFEMGCDLEDWREPSPKSTEDPKDDRKDDTPC